MKKVILVVAALCLSVASAAGAKDKVFSEVEYYRKLAEKQLAEARAEAEAEPEPEIVYEPYVEPEPEPVAVAEKQVVYETIVTMPPPMPELYEPAYTYREVVECPEEPDGPPKNAIVAIPQYFHSRNSDSTFEFGGQKLQMAKGHANGAGITVVYNRQFTDMFSVAFMYEHTFMKVVGGMAVPEGTEFRAEDRTRWHSNVIGILPEFNFKEFGKLQLSVIQGFDRSSGTESLFLPEDLGGPDQREVGSYGTNVTSLMAWYEKDFELGCTGFKLTPFAGWRSLYVKVKDQNDWTKSAGARLDDNMWVHLVSGGLKASYQMGGIGFNARAGVSHRTTRDDIPGYGNRAVAPGVVQFSHRANLDKTVGAFGVGANFAIKKRAFVGVNYDAIVGKDTKTHTGTLSVALPF